MAPKEVKIYPPVLKQIDQSLLMSIRSMRKKLFLWACSTLALIMHVFFENVATGWQSISEKTK